MSMYERFELFTFFLGLPLGLVTTFTILIVWAIVIIFEGPGLAFFLMSGLWTIHMVSYGIAGAIANKKN